MQKISPEGRKLIERWESLVLYVYDDKVPMRHINGKRQYPEWDGTHVVGTLTIGYGHTSAAGYPRVTKGLRITKEQADEILDADLEPCEAQVRHALLVAVDQHEFDVLVSFTFNCGAGNLRKLIVDLNKGNFDTFPRKLMQFVSSKGERMQGLVNRRAAELQLWNTPDEHEDPADVPVPKAERNDPPKTIATSKTGNASILVGAGGVITTIGTIGDQAGVIKGAKDNIVALGVIDILMKVAHVWTFWAAVIIIGCAAFIYWDRHRKLTEEHV